MKKIGIERLVKTGRRVIIRPWRTGDFSVWKAAEEGIAPPQNDFDYPGPRPAEKLTRKEFIKMVRWNYSGIKEGSGFFCGVFLRMSGRQVGTVGLPVIKRGRLQTGELAYRTFSLFRKKGYGKEAVAACLELGFDICSLHRIEAQIEPANKVSIKLAAAVGMKLEGVARKKVFERGAWRDLKIYSALREDYGYKPITRP